MIATADELFASRHYPSVIAICNGALEDEPACVELLLIRARAHIKLRRDLDAQTDLRTIVQLAPSSSLAFRLLGELAARRDENESAGIFFREALRLAPDDREASEWLQIVETSLHSVGHESNEAERCSRRPGAHPRFARGTRSPDLRDERPTKASPRGSHDASWKTALPEPIERTLELLESEAIAHAPPPLATHEAKRFDVPALPMTPRRVMPPPIPLPPPPRVDAFARGGGIKPGAGLESVRSTPPRRAVPPPKSARGPMPELAGFADYLVETGILSRERLRAAQAYQRSMKVQLATAIVTLGLATPQRIEWAAVAHQSQLAHVRRHG